MAEIFTSATQPLWQSGCSSDCGRVAEWLLQPLWQSGWVAEWLLQPLWQRLWQNGWVAEWLRQPLLAEWLSGCSSHSGRVAEWLSDCSSHSGRVTEWLSGCSSSHSWQSGWVHYGRVAECTLAEWLSGCISHSWQSGWVAEWLRQSHQWMKWTDKVLNIWISKQEYLTLIATWFTNITL